MTSFVQDESSMMIHLLVLMSLGSANVIRHAPLGLLREYSRNCHKYPPAP